MPPKAKPKQTIESENESDNSIQNEMPYSCIVWVCDGKMSVVDSRLIEKYDKDDKIIVKQTYKVKFKGSFLDAVVEYLGMFCISVMTRIVKKRLE